MEVKVDRPILRASIGKKVLMATTGLGLCLFLVGHLSGNLMLLKQDGGRAFNEYAEFMASNPAIYLAEAVIFLAFFLHIVQGLRLAMQNSQARPVKYKRNAGAANSTFYSRFMKWSGILLLIFLILHLFGFFVKYKVLGLWEQNGFAPGDLYSVVVFTFTAGNLGMVYSIFYILSMVFLSFHLAHGVQSATQSLGWQVNKKVTQTVQAIGYGFAILVPAGFAAVPMYFLIASSGLF